MNYKNEMICELYKKPDGMTYRQLKGRLMAIARNRGEAFCVESWCGAIDVLTATGRLGTTNHGDLTLLRQKPESGRAHQ